MVDNKNSIADNFSSALSKAVHNIYEEHPHEFNMIFYLGGALVLILGACHEYQLIPSIAK